MNSTRSGIGNYRRTKNPNGQGISAERQAEISRQIAEANARAREMKAAQASQKAAK